jgi:hypothetical protein
MLRASSLVRPGGEREAAGVVDGGAVSVAAGSPQRH